MTSPPMDRAFRATRLAPVDTTTLPPGVVGRLRGVALVYDVIDTWGTTFQRGAIARSMRERVPAGRIKLFWDHGDAHQTGSYDTDLHIGIVRAMWDEQLPDGTYAAMMDADIFDTDEGRRAHEYLRAVASAGGETGLSIGMMPDKLRTEMVKLEGRDVIRITECGLREISVTAESSVPGTTVTMVRADGTPPTEPIDYEPLLRGICAQMGADAFRATTGAVLGDATERTSSDEASGAPADAPSDAAPVDSPATAHDEPAATVYASMDERLLALRRLHAEFL